MRVLVVEDEVRLAAGLRKGLEAEGFAVDVTHNGTDGLWMAREYPYDAIVLDIMLPGMNGYKVCRTLRDEEIWTPILMLTAKDGEYDEADAFDLGADDYLVKPFQFPELLARVRALLKRGQPVQVDPVLRIGDLEVDSVRHRATRQGQRIDLTAKEFALLTLLVQKKGEVLSRTQIASMVWDIHFDSDSNVVEVAMRRLRAKIDEPFPEKLIHTVRGVGYVLEYRATP